MSTVRRTSLMLATLAACSLLAVPSRAQEVEMRPDSTWAVRPIGPALTFAGAGVFLSGTGVAAAGLSTKSCGSGADQSCTKRFGMLLAGLGVGASAGLLTMKFGLEHWRSELGHDELGDDLVRADPLLFGAGVATGVVGGVALVAGVFGGTFGGVSGTTLNTLIGGPAATVLAAVGATGVTVGIPLAALGNRKVRTSRAAVTLLLGPGNVGILGQF